MPIKRITQLPLDTAVTGPDVVPIVSDGATKRVTLATLKDFFSPTGGVGSTGPTGAAGSVGATGAAGAAGATTIAGIDGLQTALDGKAALSHTHSASDLTSGTVSEARLNHVPLHPFLLMGG